MMEVTFAPFRPFGKPAQEALPPFPWEALPPVLQNIAESLSVFAETDYALAAVPALANCSVAIGRKLVVSPKRGWQEQLNEYLIAVALSGEGKSIVMGYLNSPFWIYQDEWNAINAPIIAQWQDDLKVTEKEIVTTIDKIAKGKATRDDLAKLTERKRNLEENPQRKMRLIAKDTTPEKLDGLLSENGGTIALVSDEGGIIVTLTGGRYSKSKNLDSVLDAYTGSPISSDRIGRGTTVIRNPCLNINVTVQPVTIRKMVSDDEFNQRGLTARFLYAFPPPKGGNRKGDKPAPPPFVIDDYHDLIRALLDIKPDKDEQNRDTPRVIRFSDEAYQAYLRGVFAEKESLLRELDPDDPFRAWVARMHGHAVRLAGVLHVCEYRNEADAAPLSAETFQRAATLTGYFKAHAEYAFSMSGASENRTDKDARYIMGKFKGEEQISLHDLKRRCRRFKPTEEMQAAFDAAFRILIERGYVAVKESGGAHRHSVTVFVNPLYKP